MAVKAERVVDFVTLLFSIAFFYLAYHVLWSDAPDDDGGLPPVRVH